MNIQLENIDKSFDEAGRSHLIFRELSGTFQSGCISVVLGKSGTGKSTLLNMISGIDVPDHGTVSVGESTINQLDDRQRTLFRRRHMGFVFQFFNLIPTLTVLENTLLIPELDGKVTGPKRTEAMEILEQVGLGKRLDTMPDRLSGGEQQRVALARALCHDPQIILADEPTGNLDEETGRVILKLLTDQVRNKGKTLVMATHSGEAAAMADHVFYIRDLGLRAP